MHCFSHLIAQTPAASRLWSIAEVMELISQTWCAPQTVLEASLFTGRLETNCQMAIDSSQHRCSMKELEISLALLISSWISLPPQSTSKTMMEIQHCITPPDISARMARRTLLSSNSYAAGARMQAFAITRTKRLCIPCSSPMAMTHPLTQLLYHFYSPTAQRLQTSMMLAIRHCTLQPGTGISSMPSHFCLSMVLTLLKEI
ncbi:hypothetical protein DER46DRAFT_615124 [Fusarium sp. MPI-SDFR-AT-0072]|nr:hypothetical protein DER46DRAFT_615124 [Fusarium sp. MPI-SDFR-AT-0072]